MAGQEFAKWLRPVGCALFLIVAVLVTWVCVTAGNDPIPGYVPPENAASFSSNPAALRAELELNVFPRLEGDFTCEISGDRLIVTISSENFAVSRSAILKYYDQRLFEFVNANAKQEE